MLADGDMIGDHTWTHPDMTSCRRRAQRSAALADGQRDQAGDRRFQTMPSGARRTAPSTARSISLARSLGLADDQLGRRYAGLDAARDGEISSARSTSAHNGAIILQHFGGGPRYETLDALPEEVASAAARGLSVRDDHRRCSGCKLIYR